jgi:hypothetical protein
MSADQQSLSHTPGPWVARPMHTGGFDILDPRDRDVVTVYGGGVETESRKANARLIAAAPELLEVAIKSHEPYVGLTDADVIDLYGGQEAALCLALRAAISKALGETQ